MVFFIKINKRDDYGNDYGDNDINRQLIFS